MKIKKLLALAIISLLSFGVVLHGAGGGGNDYYEFITAIEDLNGAEITYKDGGGISSAMLLYSGSTFTLTSSPSNMFTSNNTQYTTLSINCNAGTISYNNTIVYQNENWVSSAYQSVLFNQNLSFSVSGSLESDFIDFMNNIIWYYSQNVITYIISFNGNGATGGTAPSSIEKVAGTTYNPGNQGTLYKTNYTFIGWNTDPSATTGLTSVVVNNNTTLYAIWRQNTATYTITFNGNGALYGTTPANTTANAGSTYTLPSNTGNLIKPSFNIWDEEWENGYYNNSGVPQSGDNVIRSKNYINVLPNTSFYFCCLYNSLGRILFYDNNKQLLTTSDNLGYSPAFNRLITIPNNCYFVKFSLSIGYGGTYRNDICINFDDPNKNGTYEPWRPYYFNGWNTTQNATTGLTSVVVNSNLVFYAVWVDPSATLTFNLENGTLNGYTEYEITQNRGTTIDLTQYTPSKLGFIFMGWTLSLTEDPIIITSITLTENTTIYAVWELSNVAYVIIQYNKNGATSGDAPTQAQVLKGTTYWVEDNPGNLKRPGYIFLGWNTYPSATSVIEGLNATENTTLYAIWQQKEHEEIEIQLLGRPVANIYFYNGQNPYFYTIFEDLDSSFLTLRFEGYSENIGEVSIISYDSNVVWNIYNNTITFTFNGEKLTRVSRVSYSALDVILQQNDWDRVNIDEENGYFGFSNQYEIGGKVVINLAISETNNDVDNVRNIIGNIFTSTQKLMDVKFGWITLGSIIAVVLSIGVVFFIFKIVRGGGNG